MVRPERFSVDLDLLLGRWAPIALQPPALAPEGLDVPVHLGPGLALHRCRRRPPRRRPPPRAARGGRCPRRRPPRAGPGPSPSGCRRRRPRLSTSWSSSTVTSPVLTRSDRCPAVVLEELLQLLPIFCAIRVLGVRPSRSSRRRPGRPRPRRPRRRHRVLVAASGRRAPCGCPGVGGHGRHGGTGGTGGTGGNGGKGATIRGGGAIEVGAEGEDGAVPLQGQAVGLGQRLQCLVGGDALEVDLGVLVEVAADHHVQLALAGDALGDLARACRGS